MKLQFIGLPHSTWSPFFSRNTCGIGNIYAYKYIFFEIFFEYLLINRILRAKYSQNFKISLKFVLR